MNKITDEQLSNYPLPTANTTIIDAPVRTRSAANCAAVS